MRNVGRPILCLLALPAFALLGSCRTPSSLCSEYFTERQYFEDRCGLVVPPAYTEERFCQDDDGLNCGCGAVATVENPSDVVQDCFRFLQNYECGADAERDARFLTDYPQNLPEACNPSTHFFYLD